MNYDLNIVNNATGFKAVGDAANTWTNGWFWGIILISLFVIILYRFMKQTDVSSALASASYIAMLLSLPLLFINWTSIYFTIAFAFILVGSLFSIKMNS